MAYTYLLDLYEEIDRRLADARGGDTEDPALRGKIDILEEFRTFLTQNMNDKLPKRIRKRLMSQNGTD